MPAIPSATTWEPPSRVVARQATVTVTSVPVVESSAGLSGGAIAGIVVGSVVGFILLIWVMWSCLRLGAPPSRGGVGDVDSPERCRSRSPHYYATTSRPHSHHHHHHRPSRERRHPRREVREYRAATPVVVDRRRSVSVSSPQRAYTRSRSRGRGGC